VVTPGRVIKTRRRALRAGFPGEGGLSVAWVTNARQGRTLGPSVLGVRQDPLRKPLGPGLTRVVVWDTARTQAGSNSPRRQLQPHPKEVTPFGGRQGLDGVAKLAEQAKNLITNARQGEPSQGSESAHLFSENSTSGPERARTVHLDTKGDHTSLTGESPEEGLFRDRQRGSFSRDLGTTCPPARGSVSTSSSRGGAWM
jgi:hypothetical protein